MQKKYSNIQEVHKISRFSKKRNLIDWEPCLKYCQKQIIQRYADLAKICSTFCWTDLRWKTYIFSARILKKCHFSLIWACLGMSGQTFDIYLCLLLIEFFQHAKYGPIFLSGSWNIKNWKMVQSDWLRAIFKISRKPDLSQTCGFR